MLTVDIKELQCPGVCWGLARARPSRLGGGHLARHQALVGIEEGACLPALPVPSAMAAPHSPGPAGNCEALEWEWVDVACLSHI